VKEKNISKEMYYKFPLMILLAKAQRRKEEKQINFSMNFSLRLCVKRIFVVHQFKMYSGIPLLFYFVLKSQSSTEIC